MEIPNRIRERVRMNFIAHDKCEAFESDCLMRNMMRIDLSVLGTFPRLPEASKSEERRSEPPHGRVAQMLF